MKVVILAPRGTRIDGRLSDASHVETIGWDGSPTDMSVPKPSGWASAVQRRCGNSIPARIALRLVGADNSTQFARAVVADEGARRAIAEADLIVAAEEDATLAAWRASRAARHPRAVFGMAAALVAVGASGGAS